MEKVKKVEKMENMSDARCKRYNMCQRCQSTKSVKGAITIEDDKIVKMMNKICDEGSAIENVLGDDEPEKREVSLKR